MSERWIANKFGLFNFWYYDYQEFKLSNGKIIFRGTNGSGKSVTTQSFIPLLLDGDKTPSRLDPFGSKARKIENYLLVDEKEEERTAYLYMEFKKPSVNTYITIGMGLKAKKGKKLESWYFILKDGRRIGKEFKLFKGVSEKFPFTAKQFENELGEGNVFTTSQQIYMQKVNEHLYGYSDIDNYKDLLKLLIQLRSPKLSKDFKPTVIYEILKESLNTLSEDDLRSMAEAMDNMDNLNIKLEELEKSAISANKIINVFDKYNVVTLYNRSNDYNNKKLDIKKINRDIDNIRKITIEKEELINDEKSQVELLKSELLEAKTKEENLRGSEGFNIRKQITNEQDILKNINEKKDIKENQYNNKISLKFKKKDELDKLDTEIYKQKEKVKDLLEDEEYYRNESFFEEEYDLHNNLNFKDEIDLNGLLGSINEYDDLVREAYNLIIQYENLNLEFSNMEEKRDAKKRDVLAEENKFNESQEYLTNIKSEYIEKINEYISSCIELKIENKDTINIYKDINEFYNISDCIRTINTIKEISENLKSKIINEKLILNNKMNLLNNDKTKLVNEIEKLKLEKEPILDDESLKISELLNKANIPHEYLYKCIDFNDNLKEEEKIYIESSLLNMGIINSFIVPNNFKEKCTEILKSTTYKIIFSDKNIECTNILSYVKIETNDFCNKYKNDIQKILGAISISEINSYSTYINLSGEYKIGLINGGVSNSYSLKFIGVESRIKYRELKIRELENEIDKVQEKINDLNMSIEVITNKENKLKDEVLNFPKTTDIEYSINIINENRKSLEKEENALQLLEENLYSIKKRLDELKIKTFEKTEYIKIPKSKNDYEEAISNIRSYRNSVISIKDVYSKLINKTIEMKNLKESIEDITTDADELYGDLLDFKDEALKTEQKITALKEVVETLNLGELDREYERVSKIIQTHPNEISKKEKSYVRLEEQLKVEKENLNYKKIVLEKELDILNVYRNLFKNELKLNYVLNEENISIEDAYDKTQEVYKTYNFSDKENVLTLLYEVMNKYSGNLSDYMIRVEDIFNDYEKTDSEVVNNILYSGIRRDIKLRFNKKVVNIYEILKHLTSLVDEQKLLINEKEREVFEDTLINTLSTKINAKIYKANGWIKQINDLMNQMNTSNGLKLSLKWIPKKSNSELEIDIKELSTILSTPNFITDEQREKLSLHFKEKLKKQKRLVIEQGSVRSYQTIIKEVLDYREWFEFKLSFSKPLESKKELTDNEFFKLSGGEKAMAMYIPLFAAVNARYNSADKKDCPRIIALDEAFAGVDEENIGNMFNLIEGLNLDYVLNSQVLWGTYESVKDLAIYELIRQGDDVVLPIKYHWNGKVKVMESDI